MEHAPTAISRRPALSPGQLAQGVLQGERLAIARAISLVERGGDAARALLGLLYPHTGQAHIVGVTGAPGSGKSTLVSALVKRYRAAGQAVGVVAIDPTSPFTGGAILGDRVRMRDLSGDDQVFVRSMATRGSLGGLSRSTNDAVAVLDAAGFPRIIVETVGVGQAELEIAATAHTTLVVEAPGMGDEIQAIKAGILEIADLLVVNKADRPEADRTVQALEMMLELGNTGPRAALRHHGQLLATDAPDATDALSTADTSPPASASPGEGWTVRVLRAIATDGSGVEELHAQIEAHLAWLQRSGEWRAREETRAAHLLEVALQAEFVRRLQARLPQGAVQAQIRHIHARQIDPYSAADALLSEL
ncbi:MAG: methylmalonyl Co-A mutase-associated GTPase MeaB [Litorilinea sp.]